MISFFAAAALGFVVLFTAPTRAAEFVNPVAEGADPWVTHHEGRYLWCLSEANRGISVWLSDRLTSLGTRHVVRRAPEGGPFSEEVRAAEMHPLGGKWYIYFAASDGEEVLRASDNTYPRGSVGLRVVDTYARFTDLKVTAAE